MPSNEGDYMDIRQNLVDSSKYSLKCPNKLEVRYIVVHNTANDASANNEVAYMIGTNVATSFHFAVDDKEIIQGIPLERAAFHAGDGRNGKGNKYGIGIEICYSKSGGERFLEAEKRAAKLIAYLLKKYNLDISAVITHKDCSGKYCPHRTLDMGWERFVDMVKAEVETNKENEPSAWAKTAWQWATERGYVDGTNPKGTVTREMLVQALYNLYGKEK